MAMERGDLKFRDLNMTFVECVDLKQTEICFALRHKIYCEDLMYEVQNEEKLEFDTFDGEARHFLIQNDKVNIGCFRIVPNGTPHLTQRVDAKGAFEISRFIIDYEFRHPEVLSNVVKNFPDLVNRLGLYPSYMVMEARFARFIKSKGIKIKKTSPYFELNGMRAAYLYDHLEYCAS